MASSPVTSAHIVVAQSTASSFSSVAQKLEFQDNLGLQFIWTGTTAGTFGISVSGNYNPNILPDISTFTALTLSPVPTAAGTAGSVAVALPAFPWSYYKITFTATSGTGTVDVYASGKGV